MFFRHLLRTMPYYAVAKGRLVGIYQCWPDCEKQVSGFAGARYKKFPTHSEAEDFIRTHNGGSSTAPAGENNRNDVAASSKPTSTAIGQVRRELKRTAAVAAGFTEAPAKKQRGETPDGLSQASKLVKYGNYSFHQDEDGFVHVYTDGSCEGNGKADACAGLGVYFGESHALNTAKPVSGRATNNCGEIQAASLAIRLARANGISRLRINTDSQFLINSITKWVPGWKRRNWTLATGQPVKNKTDFMELDQELKLGMKVVWHHVDGHSGILGNERADALAREGSAMYRRQKRET